MLDANDIQIISKIVSDALAEERKYTEAMFAQQKEELRAEMLAISAQQKKEMHEDMMTIVESEINPKLRILAEGHEVPLERMTPSEEIEDMKTDTFVLKEAVKTWAPRSKPCRRHSKSVSQSARSHC